MEDSGRHAPAGARPSNLTRRARRRPARFRQAIKNRPEAVSLFLGGSGEIRTHEQFNPSLVFKSSKLLFHINNLEKIQFRNQHFSKALSTSAKANLHRRCGNDLLQPMTQDRICSMLLITSLSAVQVEASEHRREPSSDHLGLEYSQKACNNDMKSRKYFKRKSKQYHPLQKVPIKNMKNLVPPVFYKYTPVEDWLPLLLNGSSIKFTSRINFNDPFDSLSSTHLNYEAENVEKYIREGLEGLNILPPEEIESMVKKIIKNKQQVDSNSGDETYLDNTGILSLASSWENILLWSHYANQHKGICIGFDSEKDIFLAAQKVIYSSDFPIIIRPDDSPDVMLEKTFLRKSKCWEYEDEWRVLKPTWNKIKKEDLNRRKINPKVAKLMESSNGPGTYKFEKNTIIDITLGMNISIEDEEKVIAGIKASAISIKLFKASRKKGQYKVQRDELSI
ncbi:DUF2971 domain-containing protein [Janthinobacterium aquaticum]|uniref:DUF2971 domain-containing protein n=1 Tax=Janthinobacterium sp. FT58W TaxID=2654254 RepID=UPI0012644A10|nr:DUF2971 domain-containing protein [Janthinobacterium sp. FT58W]KAB8036631.1 DUF2971 domain-containing protein [Janthinobacterium sp. FT58W]